MPHIVPDEMGKYKNLKYRIYKTGQLFSALFMTTKNKSECEHENLTVPIAYCADCGQEGTLKGWDFVPKVATSEKEWSCKWCGGTNTKKPLFGEPTPHESEDWEALEKVVRDAYVIIDSQGNGFEDIQKHVENMLSKSYQRGREETLKEVLDYLQKNHLDYCQEQNGLNYCKNCGLDLEDIIKHFKIK